MVYTRSRADREARLEKLRQTEREIPEQAIFERMCLNFGLTYYTSYLAWLDDVEKQVRAMAEGTDERA